MRIFKEPEGVYAFSGAQTAPPFLGTTTVGSGTTGSLGNGYASFLLGAVNSTTVNPPKDTQLSSHSSRACISRTTLRFGATSRLTLEMGVRWDRVPLGHELWDRQSEIMG